VGKEKSPSLNEIKIMRIARRCQQFQIKYEMAAIEGGHSPGVPKRGKIDLYSCKDWRKTDREWSLCLNLRHNCFEASERRQDGNKGTTEIERGEGKKKKKPKICRRGN